MFGIIHYEVFLLSAILLNLTPGTDTMYIISRSVSQGKTAGVYSSLGIISGTIVHTLLAGFGLSIILMKSILLFNIIKIIGAIYLAYLGIKLIISKKAGAKEQVSIEATSFKKIFLQGLITNVTNPKVALFFLAFIPQFINTGNKSPLPFVLLGLTFCLTGGIWCFVVANFSSFATRKLRQNKNIESILNRLTGLVFIAMSVKLLKTKAN
jgi:threonine/homoserine/homoserine lactone efflux protein